MSDKKELVEFIDANIKEITENGERYPELRILYESDIAMLTEINEIIEQSRQPKITRRDVRRVFMRFNVIEWNERVDWFIDWLKSIGVKVAKK